MENLSEGNQIFVRVSDASSEFLLGPLSLDRNQLATARANPLKANTVYTYAVALNATEPTIAPSGSLKTFPAPGTPSKFSFSTASCADTASNSQIFAKIDQLDPLFFMHMGDLHYIDICGPCGISNSSCTQAAPFSGCSHNPAGSGACRTTCPGAVVDTCRVQCEATTDEDALMFHQGYDTVMTSTTQSTLYRNHPIVYVWDDHDFGPNDANGQNPVRKGAKKAYQEAVPNYLQSDNLEDPIYQNFSVGRVKFIIMDTRMAKNAAPEPLFWSFNDTSSPHHPENPNKTMIGAKQKKWLKEQLLDGKNNFKLIILVSSVAWIGSMSKAGSLGESWWAFSAERREISDFILQNNLQNNLIIVSGDVHMVAMDTGEHNRYDSTQSKGFPVVVASPLDRSPKSRGMIEYSDGVRCNPICDNTPGKFSGMYLFQNQFVSFDIEDTGTTLTWKATGYRLNGSMPLIETVSMSGVAGMETKSATIPVPPKPDVPAGKPPGPTSGTTAPADQATINPPAPLGAGWIVLIILVVLAVVVIVVVLVIKKGKQTTEGVFYTKFSSN